MCSRSDFSHIHAANTPALFLQRQQQVFTQSLSWSEMPSSRDTGLPPKFPHRWSMARKSVHPYHPYMLTMPCTCTSTAFAEHCPTCKRGCVCGCGFKAAANDSTDPSFPTCGFFSSAVGLAAPRLQRQEEVQASLRVQGCRVRSDAIAALTREVSCCRDGSAAPAEAGGGPGQSAGRAPGAAQVPAVRP